VRSAGEQLHDEVELVVGRLAGVEGLDDPAVIDRGGDPRLGEEPRRDLRIEPEVLAHHLERDPRAGELVPRREHDAHATRANDTLDDISPVDDASDPLHQLVEYARCVALAAAAMQIAWSTMPGTTSSR